MIEMVKFDGIKGQELLDVEEKKGSLHSSSRITATSL